MIRRLLELSASILLRRHRLHLLEPVSKCQHPPRFRSGTRCLAVVVAALGAMTPAFAQSPPRVGNLVTNGDFATGTAGWTAATATGQYGGTQAGHTLADGSLAAGAATLGGVYGSQGGVSASWAQCLDLADVPLPWTLGGRIRVAASDFGSGPCCSVFPRIQMVLFSSATCSGSSVALTSPPPRGTGPGVIGPFTLHVGSTTVDPHLAAGGTQSARVALAFDIGCSDVCGGASATVHFDSLYFGHIRDLFADGFE